MKLAEVQNELEEKIRSNRRLTENLDKITEKHDMLEDELKKMKGNYKQSMAELTCEQQIQISTGHHIARNDDIKCET